MARLSIFAACLIAAFAFYSAECSTIPETFDSNVEVQVVDSIADFLKANPDITVQLLEKEEIFDEESNKAQLLHRVGNRINGDRLQASDSGNQQWSSLQDVRLNLNYPKSGLGAVVTYLEVVVDQSSNLGNAYVVAGGVGQRRISVVVEARQTLYFRYRAAVYGY